MFINFFRRRPSAARRCMITQARATCVRTDGGLTLRHFGFQ